MNVIPACPALCRLRGSPRDQGFAVVSDQTAAFLRSIALLGPRSLLDVYWAARVDARAPCRPDCGFRRAVRSFLPAKRASSLRSSAPDERTRTNEASPGVLEPTAGDNPDEFGASREPSGGSLRQDLPADGSCRALCNDWHARSPALRRGGWASGASRQSAAASSISAAACPRLVAAAAASPGLAGGKSSDA